MKRKLVDKILHLYGEVKLYGPYTRKQDGRKIIVICGKDKRTTKLLAKVKLEVKLGRLLSKYETVDHKDGNSTNDKFKNLELLSKSDNSKKAALHLVISKTRCVECNCKFSPSRHQVGLRAKTKAGPFCSKSCSGSYGKRIQDGWTPKKRKSIKANLYCYNTGQKVKVKRRVAELV